MFCMDSISIKALENVLSDTLVYMVDMQRLNKMKKGLKVVRNLPLVGILRQEGFYLCIVKE